MNFSSRQKEKKIEIKLLNREQPLTIYLIRHGQSVSRHGMGYKEASKVSLSPFGQSQSKALNKKLKKLQPEIFFVSPLKRTKETYEICSKELNHKVFYDDRLIEFNPSSGAVGKNFKEAKKATRVNPNLAFPDGESLNNSVQRFKNFLNDLRDKNYKKIAIISHALLMQNFLKTEFKMLNFPEINEASISILKWDRQLKIKSLNKVWHLPGGRIRTFKNFIKYILGMK